MLSNRIEGAQRKVEAHNFDIRKQLLEYDDVANEQRKVIYYQRNEILSVDSLAEAVAEMRRKVMDHAITLFIPPQSMEEQWDIPGLQDRLLKDFNLQLPIQQWLNEEEHLHEETLRERIQHAFDEAYRQKESRIDPPLVRQFEKAITLQMLDMYWREHLSAMDYLRQGIHLRGYAQKNPKQEYKREAYDLFVDMLDRINYEVVSLLSKFEVKAEQDVEQLEAQHRASLNKNMEFRHQEASPLNQALEQDETAVLTEPFVRLDKKVGRNEPCPCGSSKKFKYCHGTFE